MFEHEEMFPSLPIREEYVIVKDGNIEFLSDCTHELAGKTVPLGILPDWVLEEKDE